MANNEVEIVITGRDESGVVLNKVPDEAGKAGKRAGEKLADGMKAGSERLRDAKDRFVKAGREAGEGYGDGAEKGSVRGMSGLKDRIADAFRGLKERAGRAGRDAGGETSRGLLAIIGGGALAGGAAGAGVAVGAALAGGIQKGLEGSDIRGRLKASLGLNPADSAQAARAAGRAFSAAYADSMQEAADAVSAVKGSLKDVTDDKSLDRVTRDALNMSKVFGIDVAESVSLAQNLISNGLAKNSVEAFDLMTKAFQKVPAALRGTVSEAAAEYGQFFDQVGLTGPQMFDALVRGAEKGQWGIDKTGDAIKEFTIRMGGADANAKKALDGMGLNSAKLFRDVASGGAKGSAAFEKIIKSLKNIEDPSKRAQAALAIFGTPLEDLGTDKIPDFLDSLDNLGGGMKGFRGETNRTNESLDTSSRKLKSFKNAVTSALTAFSEDALDGLSKMARSDTFKDFGSSIKKNVLPALKSFGGWIKDEIIPTVKDLADNWLKQGNDAFKKMKETIAEYKPELKQVYGLFKRMADLMTDTVIPTIGPFLANGLGTSIRAITRLIATVGAAVRIFNSLRSSSSRLRATAVAVFDKIGDGASALKRRLSGAFSGAFNGLSNSLRSALNTVVGMWNRFHIPGVNIPGLGKVGGWDSPNIGYFRTGGITGSGLSVINEGMSGRGEVVRLPTGSMVYPSPPPGAAAGGVVDVRISIDPGMDRGLVREIVKALRVEVVNAGRGSVRRLLQQDPRVA